MKQVKLELGDTEIMIVLTALNRLANEYYDSNSVNLLEMTEKIIKKIKSQENQQ